MGNIYLFFTRQTKNAFLKKHIFFRKVLFLEKVAFKKNFNNSNKIFSINSYFNKILMIIFRSALFCQMGTGGVGVGAGGLGEEKYIVFKYSKVILVMKRALVKKPDFSQTEPPISIKAVVQQQTFSSVLTAMTGVVVRDFDLPVFGFVFLKSTTVWPIPESKRGMKICDKAKGSSINDVTQLLTPLYPSLSFLVQRLQKNH